MTSHSNILGLPPSLASMLSYSTQEVTRLRAGEALTLDPGRWIIQMDIGGDPLQEARLEIIDESGAQLALSMASLQILRHHSDANIVLNLERSATIIPKLEPTPPIRGHAFLNSVSVHRVNVLSEKTA
jgi:hypothetical protein